MLREYESTRVSVFLVSFPDIKCIIKFHCLEVSQRSSNYIFRKALKAADNILIQLRYPSNPKALTVKGEALYNMGDFEHALVCFHKAMRTASTKVIWGYCRIL